ncbi:unnamed protein product, partial [Brenthis ino]
MFIKSGCIIFVVVLVLSECQKEPSLPVSSDSFWPFIRTFLVSVPKGRSISLSDTRIAYYKNSTKSKQSYRLENIDALLKDKSFDLKKPTVLYIHGYSEIVTDESVESVVLAYLKHGGYNILVLDWSNLAFGNYFVIILDIKPIGEVTGTALAKLLKGGLDVRGLHIVGHSLGGQIAATTARYLASKGYSVPRVTGLDPAYPGFYPPLVTEPINPSDAQFVDVIHTNGGQFGTPTSTGHADFWPNEGTQQPGCPSFYLPLTVENLCSHWRSWHFWAESVAGGNFVAKKCGSYDDFQRGNCTISVKMGLQATPDLRGNFFLRTATEPPYALGDRGAL